MEAYPLLNDFLILLAASIPVSYLFQRLRFPSIVGFLATGMIVGPFGLRLISDVEATRALAEVGVVLLLFSIGLQFSLRELLCSGKRTIVFAVGQIAGTIVVTALISGAFGLPTGQAIFLGFLLSLSSTAIVLKLLSDQGQIDTPYGRISVSTLLFQDLCIIPMMLLTPTLSTGAFDLVAVGRQLLVALLAVAGLIVGSRYIVPLLLKYVVEARSRELFLISILAICLGAAYVSAHLGLSLAIGAFIAGLVISESSYSHQILSDILPLRDIFNAIFFISVGMLLNVHHLFSNFAAISAFAFCIVIGKAAIMLALLMFSKDSPRVSLVTAFALAQVGEFSLLLAQEGQDFRLLSDDLYQTFLSASVLTMFFTPFAIMLAHPLGMRLQQLTGRNKEWHLDEGISERLKDHLIIVGFGLNGRNLSRVVRDIGIPFVVIELNHELIRQAKQDGVPAFFGDATSTEVLHRAGAAEARMVVIAISDPAATRHCAAVVRSMNRSAVMLIRTRYLAEVESLMKLGVNIVIPEEFETSIEIFARVLEEYGIPDHLINQQISIIRSEGYGMLRGLSLTEERLTKLSELFLKSTIQQVVIGAESPAKDSTLRELNLRRQTGATVLAVIRADSALTNPPADFELQENDVLVLWGAHRELDDAVRLITAGSGEKSKQEQKAKTAAVQDRQR